MADDKRDKIQMTLKDGVVLIETRPDVAPKHVDQIKKLISEGQYDGVVFHRVIEGFMAQTGDVEFGNSSNEVFLKKDPILVILSSFSILIGSSGVRDGSIFLFCEFFDWTW